MSESKPVGWVHEHPKTICRDSSYVQTSTSNHRPRRPHTKSRNGCQNCKLRRQKCDESKPKCGRCLDLRLPCTVVDEKPIPDGRKDALSREIRQNSMSRELARTQLSLFLEKDGFPDYKSATAAYRQVDPVELVDHFDQTRTPWIGSVECQKTLQNCALQLAPGAPYLLHTVLAFSASHLSFLHPNEKKYALASILHYEHSLTLYSSKLGTSLTEAEADSLFACCHLQTMLAFRNLYLTWMEKPPDVAEDGDVHTWLHAMQGARIIWGESVLHATASRNLWMPVCIEAEALEVHTCMEAELDHPDSMASITSKALHELCEVELDSPAPGNPYQIPLSRLCRLLRREIGHGTIGMFLSFLGTLQRSFIQLLEKKDTRAMVIIGFWCSMIRRVDQWWILQSAEIIYAKFARHLAIVSDPRIRDVWALHADTFDET